MCWDNGVVSLSLTWYVAAISNSVDTVSLALMIWKSSSPSNSVAM